jgi:transcriptional regulator with XRE-family HTH domain
VQTFAPHRLRALRRARGLNGDQLAFAIGRTAQMIGHYERGKHVPTAKVLARIVDRLGCRIEDLFEDTRDGEA